MTRWVEREWLNEDGRRMRAIVTAEMAAFTDEELRLSFQAMHGVPRQASGSVGARPEPGDRPWGEADRMIEELVAWLGGSGRQEPDVGGPSAG